MRTLLAATAASALFAGIAHAEDIKLGILYGFTGPIESLTGSMAAASEAAIDEVNKSGEFLDGKTKVSAVRADSTCIDAAAATAAAEKLVTSDKVSGILGGDCSGVTGAVLQNVAIPNGMVMISPSATSPALSKVDSKGLFYRTAPSDAREGEVAADIMMEHGIKTAALTYSNSDYGKGLAEAIQKAFEAKGGKITISAAHEDGKADYSAEVASLASAGGDILIVAGYVDQGGSGILRAAVDSGAFTKFELPGGMISDTLTKNVPEGLNGSFGQVPGNDSPGLKKLGEMSGGKFDVTSPYTPESYDAAALMLLAMQAANSTKPADYSKKIMEIANGPGEKIEPGDLAKALKLIKEGKPIDYVGASNVQLIPPGESAGNYREIEVKDNKIVTVKYR
ncbi:MAG: ABC transporter substrate-binding protein [Proteobacteria bacterium]|nr:ABC transporter substrate-binding protein [Pseudomonadota bacterium]